MARFRWYHAIPLYWAARLAIRGAVGTVRLPGRAYRGWFKPQLPRPKQDRNRLLDNYEANRPQGEVGWYARRTNVEGENDRYAHRDLNSDPKTWSQDDRLYAARQDFRDNLSAYAQSRGGTAWNGGISIPPIPQDGRPPQDAGAGLDGTMYVDQSTLETLERMHMKAGKRQLAPTKRLYKSALATVNESQVKFRLWNGNHGKISEANSPSMTLWRDGVAKAIAKHELGSFIEASGANKLVKGLDKYKAVDRNPQYTAAIERVAGDIAKQTGRTPQDVLERLGSEPNGEPWKAAANLMVEEGEAARGLQGNPEAKAQLKEQLGNTYRDSLQNLAAKNCSGMKRGAIARMSGKAGRATTSLVASQIKDKVKSVDRQIEAVGRQTTMDHNGPNSHARHTAAADQAARNAVVQSPSAHLIHDAHGRPFVPERGERPSTVPPAAPAAARNNEGNVRGG